MKNNKGFSLVELLAMLVVLGILMGIAIPNITGMLKNQRLNVIRSDAKKMVDTAKIKAAKGSYSSRPKNGECTIYSLDYLNDNGNITTGPNGGKYEEYDSFVIYTRQGSSYKYYIRLVEKIKENEYSGIDLTEVNDITDKTETYVKKITKIYNLNDDSTNNVNILKVSPEIVSICPNTSKIKYVTVKKHFCTKYSNSYFDDNGDLVATAEQCEEACGAPCE